ncbi:MAG: YabP/YqfC family sporulation protein [Bacilli bacterium]|nr:YabP/YqfC family sporulation protein [Bacilli bacterium]
MRNIREYIKDPNFKLTIMKNKIDIQNYTDIDSISDNEIIILINEEKVIIKGYKLKITKLLNNEMLILGNYNNIIFEGLNE